jgi:GH24 family phage-related lysozyme (muramidase)
MKLERAIMIGVLTGLLAFLASQNQSVRQFAERVAQRVSRNGVALIKQFEGFRDRPYKDVAGHWTIGYGTLLSPDHPWVLTGTAITESKAASLLADHVAKNVDPVISRWVSVPLTQNQYDALASWLYNFNEQKLKTSTLLKKLNAGDYAGAADEFLRWNKARVDGVLQPVRGLTIRREKERALFLS